MASPQIKTQSRFVEVNGQKLHYRQWSENGTPLVFLHGVTSPDSPRVFDSNSSWDEIAPAFLSDYAVYTFDLRGHGQSSKPDKGYKWLEYAADISEFINVHIDAPCLVVGHSLGAMLTPIIAVSSSDKVKAIVLEDPPAFAPNENRTHTRNRFTPVLEIKRQPHAERVKFAIESMGRTPEAARQYADNLEVLSEHVLLELLAGGTAYSSGEWFPKVACPSLVILGNPERGGVVALNDRPRMGQLLKGSKVVIWEDVGHGIHAEQPERFVNEATAFLRSI